QARGLAHTACRTRERGRHHLTDTEGALGPEKTFAYCKSNESLKHPGPPWSSRGELRRRDEILGSEMGSRSRPLESSPRMPYQDLCHW
uniref:Uncharacterized protein n=1 Tax=Sus scrofa TaxID=9823 RepID=A0A4X1TMY1_PIG